MLRETWLALAVAGMASGATAQSLQQVAFASDNPAISQSATPDLDRLSVLGGAPQSCSSLCLAPHQAAPGVATVSEREVITFLTETVPAGAGLLIDARAAAARDTGTLPGATHIPVSVLDPSNPYRADILRALGAQPGGDALDFSAAIPLVIFDSGPTNGAAVDMIATLVAAGYPADRLRWYRGGVLVWVALGLEVEETSS